MDKKELINAGLLFLKNSPGNTISKESALSEDLIHMKIFDDPIFAFGRPDDPLYEELRQDHILGPHFMGPKDWLESAETVISFYLPFTEALCSANREAISWPSNSWLHGRIDGQNFLDSLTVHLRDLLMANNQQCVVPALDERFRYNLGWGGFASQLDINYSSNWSERHVGYICGLGSFGLSKSLITKKGTAGRFGSLITNLKFDYDIRSYQLNNSFCQRCGLCVERCPANAISLKEGKRHQPCGAFLNQTYEKHKPYFGCGLCQIDVPCEFSDPQDRLEGHDRA